MARLVPRLDQLGYVVPDLDAALREWTRARGVGPFFVTEPMRFPEFKFRGRPSDPLAVLAIAYCGATQIELIEQRNEAASGYREFLARHPQGGLQHIAHFSEDAPADARRALALGMTMQHEARSPFDRTTPLYYLETPNGPPGSVIELIQMTPAKWAGFRAMQAAAETWDGSDPVRRFPGR
jgi:catechol 2,3-dioxygenase-like lactoylglutathione lyase family enzyme